MRPLKGFTSPAAAAATTGITTPSRRRRDGDTNYYEVGSSCSNPMDFYDNNDDNDGNNNNNNNDINNHSSSVVTMVPALDDNSDADSLASAMFRDDLSSLAQLIIPSSLMGVLVGDLNDSSCMPPHEFGQLVVTAQPQSPSAALLPSELKVAFDSNETVEIKYDGKRHTIVSSRDANHPFVPNGRAVDSVTIVQDNNKKRMMGNHNNQTREVFVYNPIPLESDQATIATTSTRGKFPWSRRSTTANTNHKSTASLTSFSWRSRRSVPPDSNSLSNTNNKENDSSSIKTASAALRFLSFRGKATPHNQIIETTKSHDYESLDQPQRSPPRRQRRLRLGQGKHRPNRGGGGNGGGVDKIGGSILLLDEKEVESSPLAANKTVSSTSITSSSSSPPIHSKTTTTTTTGQFGGMGFFFPQWPATTNTSTNDDDEEEKKKNKNIISFIPPLYSKQNAAEESETNDVDVSSWSKLSFYSGTQDDTHTPLRPVVKVMVKSNSSNDFDNNNNDKDKKDESKRDSPPPTTITTTTATDPKVRTAMARKSPKEAVQRFKLTLNRSPKDPSHIITVESFDSFYEGAAAAAAASPSRKKQVQQPDHDNDDEEMVTSLDRKQQRQLDRKKHHQYSFGNLSFRSPVHNFSRRSLTGAAASGSGALAVDTEHKAPMDTISIPLLPKSSPSRMTRDNSGAIVNTCHTSSWNPVLFLCTGTTTTTNNSTTHHQHHQHRPHQYSPEVASVTSSLADDESLDLMDDDPVLIMAHSLPRRGEKQPSGRRLQLLQKAESNRTKTSLSISTKRSWFLRGSTPSVASPSSFSPQRRGRMGAMGRKSRSRKSRRGQSQPPASVSVAIGSNASIESACPVVREDYSLQDGSYHVLKVG